MAGVKRDDGGYVTSACVTRGGRAGHGTGPVQLGARSNPTGERDLIEWTSKVSDG